MNSELTIPLHPAPPKAAQAKNHLLGRVLAILLVIALLPVALSLGLLAIYEGAGLILPGVQASGMDLSSLSSAQAAGELNRLWNLSHTMTLSDGQANWQALPVEYGLFLDPVATARRAYSAGRTSYLEELRQIITQKPLSVQPVVVFNEAMAQGELEKIAKQVEVAPVEAEVVFKNGQYVAVQGQDGYRLDIAAALKQIQVDPLLMLMQGQVRLSYTPLEPQVRALVEMAERRQKLITNPLKLRAYDPISNEFFSWSIPVEELMPFVKVDDPLAEEPQATLDPKVLDSYLAKWQKETLGSGRVFEAVQGRDKISQYWQDGKELFAMIRRLPTNYTVRKGDTIFSISAGVGIPYWRIENANPGIKANGFVTGQKLVIPSKNDLLPLTVVVNKRIVISISEQRMWTYEDGKLRSKHVISTGMASSPTMPGVFQVTEHVINAYGSRWDLWMPHWLSIYEAVPTFFNGIHGLPLLRNGVRLWGSVLGSPASYGCIIMTLKEAEETYNWAEDGVVVEILR